MHQPYDNVVVAVRRLTMHADITSDTGVDLTRFAVSEAFGKKDGDTMHRMGSRTGRSQANAFGEEAIDRYYCVGTRICSVLYYCCYNSVM